MVSALDDVVAVPATVVVEKYRLPPAFLNAHCAMPPPAERESCEAALSVMVSLLVGVVVPIPTLLFVPMNKVEVPTAVLVPEKYASCPRVPLNDEPPPRQVLRMA